MGRLLIPVFLLISVASAAKNPVTLDAVINAAVVPRPEIVWAPDGERFVVSEKGQILLYEVRSGKERSVIELDKLEKAAVPSPPPAVFDWTNRRVDEHDSSGSPMASTCWWRRPAICLSSM